MEDVSSATRPRSLGVVVLDAFTTLLAPFRNGRLPTAQRIAIGIGAGIVLIGAVVLVLGTQWSPSVPTGSPQPAAADDRPLTGPGGSGSPSRATSTPSTGASDGSTPASPSGSASSAPTTRPPTVGPAGAAPQAQPLQARFGKVAGSEGLTGYRATVTITNPGPVAASGWKVTVTLPRETLTISNVDGATTDRRGAVWTLSPTTGTSSVGANGSVSITFQVNGAAILDATPTACTIDGQACSGL